MTRVCTACAHFSVKLLQTDIETIEFRIGAAK